MEDDYFRPFAVCNVRSNDEIPLPRHPVLRVFIGDEGETAAQLRIDLARLPRTVHRLAIKGLAFRRAKDAIRLVLNHEVLSHRVPEKHATDPIQGPGGFE